MKESSQEENQIQSIIYPYYPYGCSPQEFIAHYEPLIEALRSFDGSTRQSLFYELALAQIKRPQIESKLEEEEEVAQHITMTIIKLLNASCSHCHRKQYSQKIFSLLSQFKGNLKNLAIGKTAIQVSYWSNLLEIKNPTTLYYGIKQQQLLTIYDEIYQQLHYIPHRQTFLINYSKIVIAGHKFQNILKSTQNSLPIHHQLYLAIIASATYGCKYQWSRSVAAFLKAGGQISWIQKGSTVVPPLLQEMSNFSTMVAYNFKQLYNEKVFGCSSSQNEYRFLALIWLCYYQALACIDLVCGFVPQRQEYFEYLPHLPSVRPSIRSFEAVKHTEGMDNVQEIRAAEEFSNLYSWEIENEENIKIKIEGARSINVKAYPKLNKKRIQSTPQTRDNQIYLLGQAEQQQIFEKISNLQSLRYLRCVFEKYVHFQPLINNYTNRTPTPFIQDSLVLASEWDFELKGLNKIELVLGSKVRHSLQNLILQLRVQNNQKSKQLKHYYQFFNNYMYEYESYTKIMKQISINQKNYLKLVTKSPFLFTDQAFFRMKNDLSKVGIDAVDFLLEAVSFKLQLSINLLSFLLDKAGEDQ